MKSNHKILILFFLVFTSNLAFSSHFRTGKITWTVTPGTRTVNFKITHSWRIGAGETISLSFGDGLSSGQLTNTTILTVPNEYDVFESNVSHTYSSDGPFTVGFVDYARISNLQNGADDDFYVSSKVCLANGNTGSPIINTPTVIEMSNNGNNSYQLPVSDPDGSGLTFSTTPILGNSYIPIIGGNSASINQSGLITWNTTGAIIGQLYLFKIKVSDGCAETESEYIIKIVSCPPVVTGTISGNSSIFQGGSANLTITFSGIGPWTYRLSGTTTDVTTNVSPVVISVSPLNTTTYTLLSVSGNGGSCGSVAGAGTVTVSCEPIATITGSNTIDSGQSTNLTISFSGIGPWTYRLSGTTTDVTTNTSPVIIPVIPSSSTTYTLSSVSNSSGFCTTSTGSAIVTVNCPVIATVSGTATINSGQTTNITIAFTGAGPWTYRLSGTSTDVSTNTSPVIIPVTPISTTTYTVSQVTHDGGYCALSTGSALVTVVCPMVATISGTASVISGQTTNVTINFTGIAPWTYRLSGTSTDITTSSTPVIIPVTLNSSANYTLTNVTHQGGFCATATGTANISVTCPTVVTISGTNSILKGQSTDLTLNFTGTGPWTYRLSGTNTDVTTNITPVVITVTPQVSTTYSITTVTHNGSYCAYATGSANITVTCPVTATISGNATINKGQSTPLTINFTETGPWTYRINGINANFTTSNNPTIIPVAPTASTIYTLSSVSNSCGFGTVSGSAAITVIVPINLISCYNFTGNANDGKGNNNGNVVGATLTTDRFGNPNSAYYFNGTNNYIDLTNPNNFVNNEYTYSAWVNVASLPPLNDAGSVLYVGKGQGMVYVNRQNEGTVWGATVYNDQNLAYDFNPSTTSNTEINTWHHVVIVRRAFDIKIYVDGVLFRTSTTASNTTPTYFSSPGIFRVTIGTRPDNTNIQFFNGKIDDVKIYDGAIKEEEVVYLFNEESGSNQCSDFCTKYIYTLSSGNWNDPAIWSCNRVPLTTDVVLIKQSHNIVIDNITANAKNVILGGTIDYLNNGTIQLGN